MIGDRLKLRGVVSYKEPSSALTIFWSFLLIALISQILGILDLFAIIGYAILLGASSSPGVRYFACYLIAIPLYCGPGLNEICM